jgi:hypothetical protein
VQEDQLDPSADFEVLAPRFEALGLADIAARLRALARPPVWHGARTFPLLPAGLAPDDVLTVEAAAERLGLRSAAMLLTMAELGMLEGFSHGDETLLSRQSVERYRESATLGMQRRLEDQLLSILVDADL